MSDSFVEFRRRMEADMAKAFSVPAERVIEGPGLTARMIEAQMRELRATPPPIIYTLAATEPTLDRLFPESRHRSARIRKKLIKRFGGEYRRAPAILRTDIAIFAHPIFRAQIEHARSAA